MRPSPRPFKAYWQSGGEILKATRLGPAPMSAAEASKHHAWLCTQILGAAKRGDTNAIDYLKPIADEIRTAMAELHKHRRAAGYGRAA